MTLLLVLQFEELPPLTTATLGALIPKVCKAGASPYLQPPPPPGAEGKTLSTRVGVPCSPPPHLLDFLVRHLKLWPFSSQLGHLQGGRA